MRTLVILTLLATVPAFPCTSFITSQAGRTFVGNNEDSWCLEGRIRFVPGEAGRLGAVYFSSWRGHPYLPWADQLGMNEAGLVFDGLTIQPKDVAPSPGKPALEFGALTNQMLEQCRDVAEAVDFLRKHDLILLHKSMIFLADAQGRYAVVQNDTILLGDAPYFAVGNWRLDGVTEHDAIPIPRLQQGRELLEAGTAPTVEGAWSVLERMQSCRKFLGNGTFFSTLFEPDSGKVHVAFYHDYSHRITFDLHEELSKGPHTLDLPSLFPPNEAYQALQAYRTPFHQRWLFWPLVALVGIAVLLGAVHLILFVARSVAQLRGRPHGPVHLPFVGGLTNVMLVLLLGLLLVQEPVFYFGLGDVHPALVALPWLLLAGLLFHWRRGAQEHVALRIPHQLSLVVTLVLATYWGLWW